MDGNKESLNIAHEAVDRHASSDNTAINIAHSDGHTDKIQIVWSIYLAQKYLFNWSKDEDQINFK